MIRRSTGFHRAFFAILKKWEVCSVTTSGLP
jgi:hypothetical protein